MQVNKTLKYGLCRYITPWIRDHIPPKWNRVILKSLSSTVERGGHNPRTTHFCPILGTDFNYNFFVRKVSAYNLSVYNTIIHIKDTYWSVRSPLTFIISINIILKCFGVI